MIQQSVISFTRGAPSVDIIDTAGLAEAAQKAFSDDPAGSCGYGPVTGYPPLREWIAERHGVSTDEVMVTNGSMQAFALVTETLVAPNDTVIVEAPTYDRSLTNLRRRAAHVSTVPMEQDGIDVDALEKMLESGIQPILTHIIATFQNPSGATLSGEKRERLLRLAATHGFRILEDDPYSAIRFEGESLPTMRSQDAGNSVVYMSSFSKTICPGIRCGYLIGSADMIKFIATTAITTYISPNMVAQSTVNQYCRSGRFDRALETIRSALRDRRDAMAEAMRRELPEVSFTLPNGGYFMWLTLPDGMSSEVLLAEAAERDVEFLTGTSFLLDGGQDTFRLSYASLEPDVIDRGVRRLGAAFRAARSARLG